MTICARCGKRFDPNQNYHSLCGECSDEVGISYDADNSKFWKMASTWMNNKWTYEEMKELADSAAGQQIVKDILGSMDLTMKIRLLKKQIADME